MLSLPVRLQRCGVRQHDLFRFSSNTCSKKPSQKKNLEWHLSKNFTNFIIFVVFNCFKHWPSIITCYCFSLMRIPHTCSVLLLEIYHLQWSGHSSFRGWSPSGTMQTWHVNMCVCSTRAYVYIIYIYIIYIYSLHIYLNTKTQKYRYVIGRFMPVQGPICWNKQRDKLNKQLLDFAITRHIINENISWNPANTNSEHLGQLAYLQMEFSVFLCPSACAKKLVGCKFLSACTA